MPVARDSKGRFTKSAATLESEHQGWIDMVVIVLVVAVAMVALGIIIGYHIPHGAFH